MRFLFELSEALASNSKAHLSMNRIWFHSHLLGMGFNFSFAFYALTNWPISTSNAYATLSDLPFTTSTLSVFTRSLASHCADKKLSIKLTSLTDFMPWSFSVSASSFEFQWSLDFTIYNSYLSAVKCNDFSLKLLIKKMCKPLRRWSANSNWLFRGIWLIEMAIRQSRPLIYFTVLWSLNVIPHLRGMEVEFRWIATHLGVFVIEIYSNHDSVVAATRVGEEIRRGVDTTRE